jgi:hypothetical protein
MQTRNFLPFFVGLVQAVVTLPLALYVRQTRFPSTRKLAISPELNQRLLEAFPPGATEEALKNFL